MTQVEGKKGRLRHGLTLENLACPGCHGPLIWEGENLACQGDACHAKPGRWPVVDGAPILLDEACTLWEIDSFLVNRAPSHLSQWRRIFSAMLYFRPFLSNNVAATRNYRDLVKRLEAIAHPLVLIVGCGEQGVGLPELLARQGVIAIGLDLRWTKSVTLIADGQHLPFRAQVFDAVILQGVLEHVLDPFLVEQEVFRTLKEGGMIYCELPFLQPNHGGAFDFIRFTQVGHRRFWRRFEEIDGGVSGGPAVALALVTQQFCRALLPWRVWRILSDWLTDWTLWWLKYLDYGLIRTPAGVDGASAYYFLGRKSQQTLADKELIQTYRGAQ